jgi:hypothetical protein
MKQSTFASLSFETKKKRTRREVFLGEIDLFLLVISRRSYPCGEPSANVNAPAGPVQHEAAAGTVLLATRRAGSITVGTISLFLSFPGARPAPPIAQTVAESSAWRNRSFEHVQDRNARRRTEAGQSRPWAAPARVARTGVLVALLERGQDAGLQRCHSAHNDNDTEEPP